MSAAQRGGGDSRAGWKDLEAGEIHPDAVDLRAGLPSPPELLFQNDGSFMSAFLAAASAQQPAASEAGTGDAPGAPADAAREAGGSAPPDGEAKKKGPLVLKARSSIVKVRSRKGELLQPSSKKKEAEDSSKPFYLRELDRYRQHACDNKSGDRPLVK